MAIKFPPAKIFVNKPVEIDSLRHPREFLLRNISITFGFLNLLGLAWIAFYFPLEFLVAIAVAFLLVILIWKLSLHSRLGVFLNATTVSESNFPEIQYSKRIILTALDRLDEFEVLISGRMQHYACWIQRGFKKALVLNDRIIAGMIGRDQIGQLIWLIARMAGLRLSRQNSPVITLSLLCACLNPLALPFYLRYRRVQHFTADRIGLALIHSLIDAAEAFQTTLTDR